MADDLFATADFCLIPMGAETSVGPYIAKAHQVLEKSGLKFTMHGYGTNLEGPWGEVCKTIQDCHKAVHEEGAPRIATDIRIGTRVDRTLAAGSANADKLARVQDILKGWEEKPRQGSQEIQA